MKVWDARTGQALLTYAPHTGEYYAVASSPDSKYIAAGDNSTVYNFAANTGRTLQVYTGHSDDVSTVAWSPDGTKMASSSADGTAQIWKPVVS